MTSRKQCMAGVFGLLCLMSGLGTPLVQSCTTVARDGDHVQIAEETAAIVWDPAHGVEHFIRQATFNTKAKNFGFLVPTPTTPELAEANPGVFNDLENLIAVVTTTSTSTSYYGEAGATKKAPAIQVIKSQRVGGMDAVVLQANDEKALTRWLRRHGYAARPALNRWFAPYIKAQWKITAFKIAAGRGSGTQVASSVVRMSFPTRQPFFPYREPSDQRKGSFAQFPRLLKVYLLGDGPMEGRLGSTNGWPGQRAGSNSVDEGERIPLAGDFSLRPNQLPSKMWLTVFEDHSSPRPGTDDVYFRPAPTVQAMPLFQKSSVKAYNRRQLLIGIGILIAVSFGIAFIYVQGQGRRRSGAMGPSA